MDLPQQDHPTWHLWNSGKWDKVELTVLKTSCYPIDSTDNMILRMITIN